LPIIAAEMPAIWKEIDGIEARPWTKRNGGLDAPRTMRVDYKRGLMVIVSEWVCVDHPIGSYARAKADGWLIDASINRREHDTVETLCARIQRPPVAVRLRLGGDFPEVVERQWKAKAGDDFSDHSQALAAAMATADEPPF
jgi:hypothetical protein